MVKEKLQGQMMAGLLTGMLRSDSVCATSKVIVNLRGSQKTPELSRTIQRTVKKGST